MTSTSSYPSTASLQSNYTVKSTTPLTSQRPQKDYLSAFGNLQSQYGTTGYFPTPVAKPSTSHKHTSKRGVSNTLPTTSSTSQSLPTSSTNPPKDYESAFGSLSSSYGFGGSVPTPPHKSKDSKSKNSSFFSSFKGR